MCVLFLALDQHPRWPVIVATNRDEQYGRATVPAGRWREDPHVIAGRDAQAGGTWFGATDGGRWAALTNVRDLPAHRDTARSRGDLPAAFLRDSASPEAFVREVFNQREAFNPFNLLVGHGADVWVVSTHESAPYRVSAGVRGLSNATLDVPWPKVERGKRHLSHVLSQGTVSPEALFDFLADAEPAPDEALPETGVGLEWERTLSPIYIASPDYGTRASTVLLLDRSGGGRLIERTTAPEASGEARTFTLRSRPIVESP